jgi:hypothetical protein
MTPTARLRLQCLRKALMSAFFSIHRQPIVPSLPTESKFLVLKCLEAIQQRAVTCRRLSRPGDVLLRVLGTDATVPPHSSRRSQSLFKGELIRTPLLQLYGGLGMGRFRRLESACCPDILYMARLRIFLACVKPRSSRLVRPNVTLRLLYLA